MKKETIIKVLARYEKGLEAMVNIAIAEKESRTIINQYAFDKRVFEQAIKELRKE